VAKCAGSGYFLQLALHLPSRVYARGWVSLGLKSPIELDILQKLDYLGKGD